MLKKVLTISLLSSMITACSFNSTPSSEYIPYQEIDGKIEKVKFMSTISSSNPDLKGSAHRQMFFGDLPTFEEIGDIYHIYDANAQPINVIFLMDEKTSLNPKSQDQMKELAKAKTFDFYEFGKGRIAHAKFSAKKSICQDFKSKNGLNVVIATSYYLNLAKSDDFYASLISAHIKSNKEIVNFDYKPNFYIQDEKTLNLVKAEEQQQGGEKFARQNLQEKFSLITNFVCEAK